MEALLNVANPLNKYTEADMSLILSDSPVGLLEGIDKERASLQMDPNQYWQVLTRLFITNVCYQPNHHAVAMDLIMQPVKSLDQWKPHSHQTN